MWIVEGLENAIFAIGLLRKVRISCLRQYFSTGFDEEKEVLPVLVQSNSCLISVTGAFQHGTVPLSQGMEITLRCVHEIGILYLP